MLLTLMMFMYNTNVPQLVFCTDNDINTTLKTTANALQSREAFDFYY